jgi:hypothetical protein
MDLLLAIVSYWLMPWSLIVSVNHSTIIVCRSYKCVFFDRGVEVNTYLCRSLSAAHVGKSVFYLTLQDFHAWNWPRSCLPSTSLLTLSFILLFFLFGLKNVSIFCSRRADAHTAVWMHSPYISTEDTSQTDSPANIHSAGRRGASSRSHCGFSALHGADNSVHYTQYHFMSHTDVLNIIFLDANMSGLQCSSRFLCREMRESSQSVSHLLTRRYACHANF